MGNHEERSQQLSRRRVLGLAGALAGSAAVGPGGWSWALGPAGTPVRTAVQEPTEEWRPLLLDPRQAETVALLAEDILPRTDTPGARDARVHEYIDLALSVEDEAAESFLAGLSWLEERSRAEYGRAIADLDEADRRALLASISDVHEELPAELEPGAELFEDLKRMTVFAYYTSEVGRVEELGLPDSVGMERWQGCRHGGDDHTG